MARQTITTIHQQHGNRLKALGQGTNLQSPPYALARQDTIAIFKSIVLADKRNIIAICQKRRAGARPTNFCPAYGVGWCFLFWHRFS